MLASVFTEGVRNMTKEDLKKLSRLDLVEMLLEITRENEQLRKSLDEAERKLNEREIVVGESGNLAEAALRLNGVLEAAQAAADQYLENIRMREEQQKQICIQMEQRTQEKCNRMMQSAKNQVDNYLNQINSCIREMSNSYSWKSVKSEDAKDSET